jgi:hypothetical protein
MEINCFLLEIQFNSDWEDYFGQSNYHFWSTRISIRGSFSVFGALFLVSPSQGGALC